jgi:chromosome partitioning protein
MKNILVANPKGGSGKTTLATNLAGYFASLGQQVLLSDLDRQQSSTYWLQRRPTSFPAIEIYNAKSKSSHSADWIISDSPGGFRDEKLSDAVKQADCVIVPIQPSAFDIGATQDFLELLIEEKAVRKQKTFVALVGMRVNSRTHSAAKLMEFKKCSSLCNSGRARLKFVRYASILSRARFRTMGAAVGLDQRHDYHR